MAGRKRATATAPDEEQVPQYQLEPLDDDLRSRLNVWGNSTLLAIQQLEERAPGWAGMLGDIFAVVGEAMRREE